MTERLAGHDAFDCFTQHTTERAWIRKLAHYVSDPTLKRRALEFLDDVERSSNTPPDDDRLVADYEDHLGNGVVRIYKGHPRYCAVAEPHQPHRFYYTYRDGTANVDGWYPCDGTPTTFSERVPIDSAPTDDEAWYWGDPVWPERTT